MNGYNFTEQVRRSLALAREEAAQLGHEYVGTEHILLGMIREHNVATTVIENLGVKTDSLRERVIELAKPGKADARHGPDLPYASRAKKSLELAMMEARELRHDYVGTEHLLLGVLREERGLGAQALKDAGITLDGARAQTLRVLSQVAAAPGRAPARRAPAQPQSVGERFRVILDDAYDVAAERDCTLLAPAHVMIALLEHADGVANTALDRLGLDRGAALLRLNELTPRGTEVVGPETVMRRSDRLQGALAAAERLRQFGGQPAPGSHHLLLGILEASPEVLGVLVAQGITAEMVRDEIRRGTG